MLLIAQLGIPVALTALSIFVWRARPKAAVKRSFARYTALMACWAFGVAGVYGGGYLEISARFAFARASLMPWAFLTFAQAYPASTSKLLLQIDRATLVVGVLFACLSLAGHILIYDIELLPSGLTRKSGPLYPAFAVYFVITWMASFGILARKWLKASLPDRAQLNYLGIALAVSGAGGISANLLVPWFTGRSTY